MPRDRLLSRKATQASRTPLTPTPALSSTLSSGQTDAPTQQPASEPAQSAHNFSDVSVLAQEPQPAEEQEEQTAIDTEQSNQIVAKQGAGTPLAPSVRENMETAFGYNFGQVRIHTDAEADTLSRSLDAPAFTLGRDIFFSQQATNTGLSAGSPLLAHELTHVVQQGGTAAARLEPGEGLAVSEPDDASEREADQTADAVITGETPAERHSRRHYVRSRWPAPSSVNQQPQPLRRQRPPSSPLSRVTMWNCSGRASRCAR